MHKLTSGFSCLNGIHNSELFMKTYLAHNTSCDKRNHCLHVCRGIYTLWKPTACRRMYTFYNTYEFHSWHYTGMFRPLLHETIHFANSQRPGMVVTRHRNPLQLLCTTAWNVLCKFCASPTFPVYHINQSCATMRVLGDFNDYPCIPFISSKNTALFVYCAIFRIVHQGSIANLVYSQRHCRK